MSNSDSTWQQDFAFRHRILLVVEHASTNQTRATQYVSVDLVRNGVTYIILYSMFATLLFVLLCAVLFKNGLSPQKRRLPFVWVLGIAMLGGLLGSTLNTVFWAYQLFGNVSEGTMFRLWMSSTATLYLVPLITHVAIELRLLSFYPPTLASRRKRIFIGIIPSLMKVARLTSICITLNRSAVAYHQNGFGVTVSKATNDISNLFTLIFQLVDTLYASAILLWRYWHLGRRDNELMNKKSHPAVRWAKQLGFAIAFGYVLPTIYALALVLCKALSLSPVDMGFMLVANVYVQAFGAVLASLSSAYKWREDRFTDDLAPDNAVLPGMRDANDLFATGATPTCDTRHVPALESVVFETPSRPNFITSRLPSLDSRQRGLNSHSLQNVDAGLTGITIDGNGVTTPRGNTAGDISPKSSAHQVSNSSTNEERSQYLPVSAPGTNTDGISIDFPINYALQHHESRRSSDATLFAPSGGLNEKTDFSFSRPGSRPGSSGTRSIQRLDSSRSVPREGSLQEEEESIGSPISREV
ncbi:hypothetical protein NDA11_007981 [Ustilago hordei]|uniref:Uncharacterized protein n=1 Tax=Ustilago hordei TaxID=120017 RepID=I2G422_USTHO|nr:uncharacterized protein UHO2_01034 [Ustilago hordei]KAJ1043476.1 hypothetical protein NDA10_006177 [Ustilago hordei]KAJ1583551.1 hypothetical protein NDA15_004638 [Ustilago hordei]KAJ1584837.1 hypothetical protein NDA11_007981 [Ustilago hordei]KAJ1591586.1 hypothetical protein NDA12_001316 [Ustilago hordei]KAJ1603039.1 hypothetical protein NDA14_003053 [Ustilago hordei]